MERYAVFVDAGYLMSAGHKLLEDNGTTRYVDGYALLRCLNQVAKRSIGEDTKLLRVYWYDASPGRQPLPGHVRLGRLPDIKVRLGLLTTFGKQKNVDSMLWSDLTTLVRNKAISDAILLSGDGDFVDGVMEAQSYGVRVHLLEVQGSRSSMSLYMEADRNVYLGAKEISSIFGIVDESDQAVADVLDLRSHDLFSRVFQIGLAFADTVLMENDEFAIAVASGKDDPDGIVRNNLLTFAKQQLGLLPSEMLMSGSLWEGFLYGIQSYSQHGFMAMHHD